MRTENQESRHVLKSLCAIIPAREPEPILPSLVQELLSAGFGAVVVVDDGSSPRSEAVFREAGAAGAQLLRHAVNLGKGRALKTAFNAILITYPDVTGVITADADGQHTVSDIINVGHKLAQWNQPILGSRSFAGKVPLRSRIGNSLTRYVFGIATGALLDDTQSGLRGLPRQTLFELITLEGEHYEFEMNMLAHLCHMGRRPIEVPIETVYIEGNRSSHFSPIRDSMRIYFVLARFVLSSIIAAGLDLILFTATFALTSNLVMAVGVGRISSLVNFTLNRQYVFRNRSSLWRSLLAYYLLASAVALASYISIMALSHRAHWNIIAAKLLVDSILSLVSFSIQRTFIFQRSQKMP